jgi:hypothetical protein
MRKLMKAMVLAGLVLALGAGPSWAAVQVTQVVLSPQMLLDIYRAVQVNSNRIDWNNPNIIQLAALADAASAGQHLAFTVEIQDGSTWVARAGRFQVLSRAMSLGPNLFNANDIGNSGLTLAFNNAYAPNTDNLASGGVMPAGNFRVLFTPVNPATGAPTGPAYIMSFALFTPRSALNQPPIPIYPRGVSVNTSLPLFSWTSVPNAAAYEVQVGPDQDTNVNLYWRSPRLGMTQALYAADARALENGQRYYWQVRALDGLGNPIGGVDGRSQAADFTVNSSARATTAAAPAEVEAALRAAIKDPAVFTKLTGYQPVAIETTADDLAGLLQQLRDGTAAVVSAGVE